MFGLSISTRSLRFQLFAYSASALLFIGLISMLAVKRYAYETAQFIFDSPLANAALQILEEVGLEGDELSVDLPFSAFSGLADSPRDKVFYLITTKQKEFVTGYESLLLEDIVNVSNVDILQLLENIDLNKIITNDLNNIIKHLGKKFVDGEDYVLVDKMIVRNIKSQFENIIKHNNICNIASSGLMDDIHYLGQSNLKSQLTSYTRLVAQLSPALKKEIYDFEIEGDDTVLVEDKFRPFIKSLIHLFRNNVDHGIETPEQRALIGKDEIGTISCKFTKSSNNLSIVVSDDGAGIDVQKIKSIVEDDTTNLTNEEIYEFIFRDNMSTKDVVTSTSGRGVGMSIIKYEIEKLNGTITIKSEQNVGTTFIFNIPC